MNPESCECSKAELELFTVPPTNVSMEKGSMVECLPISTIGDRSPVEFVVSSSNDEYIDIGRTFLYVKVKIVNQDKSDLEQDAKCGPVNLFMHSLFSQIDLQLNGKLISPSINTYPYKAYLETLLSYGSDAKKSQLGSELWYFDNGNMNEFNPHVDEGNDGFITRGKMTSKSKAVEMMGRLHCDFFQQDRYLINGVEMKLKLIRSPEAFHLMADDDKYLTVIEDVSLFVRKVKLNPAIPVAHNKALSQGKTVKYPIRRGIVSTFTIPTGNMSINKDNVVMGQLPRRVIVGLVTNQSVNGDVKSNPYDFKNLDLNYFALYVDGELFPNKPLDPDFEDDQFLRAYMTLFEGTGMLNDNKGHGIKRTNYKNGFALYAFDLTPDMTEGSHIDPIKHGSIRMEIHFKKALAQTVNAIIYSEYDNLIQIDRARNVITDF